MFFILDCFNFYTFLFCSFFFLFFFFFFLFFFFSSRRRHTRFDCDWSSDVCSSDLIDEAYINFSSQKSFTTELKDYPNLVIMQTLSKAWGLAALRIGIAFASEEIVYIMNKIKPPYNISQASQELVLQALEETMKVNDMIREIVAER